MSQFAQVLYVGHFIGSASGPDPTYHLPFTATLDGTLTVMLSEAADGAVTGSWSYKGSYHATAIGFLAQSGPLSDSGQISGTADSLSFSDANYTAFGGTLSGDDATLIPPAGITLPNGVSGTLTGFATAGHFSLAAGDLLDLSPFVQSGFDGGQPADALVRIVDDPSNAHALLQIDNDGSLNGAHWTTLGQVDGLHGSDHISVLLNSVQSAGTTFSVLSNDGHFGDMNGDGKADLVWRNDAGAVATWQMDGGGVTQGNFLTGVSSDWHIQGTGDFNGDGRSDILWLNDNGSTVYWQMTDATSFSAAPSLGNAPANSVLAGIGDVDADGKSDLIWRDSTTGAVTINTMAGATNTIAGTGNEWSIVGVGDFNGDGNADIMFRNESQGVNAAWLMNGTTLSGAVFYPGVPNDWHVEGTGDFNGDGTADLLWHNDNGANAVWLMDHSGNIQTAGFFDGVGSDWHVVGTGDFDGRTNNGHPIDDVIWRSDNGATAVWLMDGTNAPSVSFPGGVPAEWATQAHHYEFV